MIDEQRTRAIKLVDDAIDHYCRQGKPLGHDGRSCVYKGSDGECCAVGLSLIRVDEMTDDISGFEGDVRDLCDNESGLGIDLAWILNVSMAFLESFQRAHDQIAARRGSRDGLLTNFLIVKQQILDYVPETKLRCFFRNRN